MPIARLARIASHVVSIAPALLFRPLFRPRLRPPGAGSFALRFGSFRLIPRFTAFSEIGGCFLGKFVNRYAVQNLRERRLRSFPDWMNTAPQSAFASGALSQADVQLRSPFHRFDHLQERHVPGRSVQTEAAARPAVRIHQALMHESLQNLREEVLSHSRRFRQGAQLRLLSFRQRRQVDHHSHCVIRCSRDLHLELDCKCPVVLSINSYRPFPRSDGGPPLV